MIRTRALLPPPALYAPAHMDAANVQRLAKDAVRLRAQSVAICSSCNGSIVPSHQLRGQHRVLLQEIA